MTSDFEIARIRVDGLHGATSYDIPVRDNRIVLVGVNGLGKTTIVNMLFCFLTRQWARLSRFSFASISIELNGELLTIEKNDLLTHDRLRRELLRLAKMGESETVLSLLSSIVDMPSLAEPERKSASRLIRDIKQQQLLSGLVSPSRLLYLLQRSFILRGRTQLSQRVVEVSERLEKAPLRVLYLPTYRRIEQDLEEIFPGVSDEIQELVRDRIAERQDGSAAFVELVEFGMGDVEASIKRATDRIRNTSRVEFSNLAGSYLRDVIRGNARKWERSRVVNITEEQAAAIVSRVEERTLSVDDREKIIDAIRRARTNAQLTDDDQLLAHFFWKLTAIFDKQKEAEGPLRQFVEFCNRYLSGKRLVFDEAEINVTCVMPSGGVVKFKDLSSGEKQIVSLFSQLLLDAEKAWAVIIDEPELSLSVTWQKQLLPDLLATGRCNFIAAVTHSPFVFDNALQDHTFDLSRMAVVHR